MISDFDLEGKNKLQKAIYYLKHYGMVYTLKKAMRKIGIPVSQMSEYMAWCKKNATPPQMLEIQAKSDITQIMTLVVVAGEGTDFKRGGWERQTCQSVILAEITEGRTLTALLNIYKEGDAFVFCGRNIKVQPDFLFEVFNSFHSRNKKCISRIRPGKEVLPDLVYTDEDNCFGKTRCRPFFKPDASMQMLLNFPYLGECFAVRRSLLEKIVRAVGHIKLNPDSWYGLSLQAFRLAVNIRHIPKVLFSNVVGEQNKTEFYWNQSIQNEDYLKEYLELEEIPGEVIKSDVPGFFHIRQKLKEEPLVSIIIPNKDHIEDLKLCLTSLAQKSNYTNYEVIIAENNSQEPETFSYYESLQEEDKRISVITWEGPFNYSAINNFAARQAKGELLLFLNNDTEFMDADSLREMVVSVLKPGVGACGAMLYYGDNTIQHAGVIIGMGGFAAHALWSLTDRDGRYFPFSLCEREVSAVTGACLMVRRDVFEEVGGMEEEFVVALNDVDFCMKVRVAGYDILFNPYAKLYHYESKSRGYEDTEEKQARFQSEIDRFQEKWQEEIEKGDPFYNPNLTLHRADYSMDI